MSFTTDIYAAIAEDMRTKPIYDTKSMAMRRITYNNMLNVAFAINKGSNLRSIYLSIGNATEKIAFPKWKGVNIELAKLPDYGTEDLYVVMKELPNSAGYIFEIVAEDLRKAIEEAKDFSIALAAITNVLAKWKNFFQYDGEVMLSEFRQQGLMGELHFLSEVIQEIGVYSVAKWAGCNDETHDFYFNDHAVEVKTTSTKEPYRAHISSEYQMDVLDVSGNLFLKFYAFRKSKSTGITLPKMVESIRRLLNNSEVMLEQFNDKLQKYGYFDEVGELYSTGYYIRDDYQFLIEEGFPCITSSMYQAGISDVEYSIGISHCSDYEITKEALLNQLKGVEKDVE